MNGEQLALDCDPAWTTPTAGSAPTVDWAVREQRIRLRLGVSPCGWLDTLGQRLDGRPIRDVTVTGGVL